MFVSSFNFMKGYIFPCLVLTLFAVQALAEERASHGAPVPCSQEDCHPPILTPAPAEVERENTKIPYFRMPGTAPVEERRADHQPPRTLGGEATGGVARRPVSTRFLPAGTAEGPNVFSRTGNGSRAVWGVDEQVRFPDTTEVERNPSMASDAHGNLWLAFEDASYTPQRINLYWSSNGGENWLQLGQLFNPDAELREPSLAVGAKLDEVLLVAYILDDGVNMPVPEVARAALRTDDFTIESVPVWNWEGYAKPVVWTDSASHSQWRAYLTCEGIFDSAAQNINVCTWNSKDLGHTWEDECALLGNTDSYAWCDPDGSFGTTKSRNFITCFNKTDDTLYCVRSEYGAWQPEVAVYTLPDLPNHPVDPEVEAAVYHDNVLICCTKSFNGDDNIGTSWSSDGGETWTYLYSMSGYTAEDEYAPALTANEGGGSWHLAFTSKNKCYYNFAPQDYSNVFQATVDRVDDSNNVSELYPMKAIASSWSSDCAGIAWADFRDTAPDYDIYFDRMEDPTRVYVPEEHATIQAGIDSATAGQTVHVNKGVYHESRILYNGKAIRVQSVHGPSLTIIDGGRNDFVVGFMNGETQDAVLEGFTIRNGYSGAAGGVYVGAPLSMPVIIGNVIRDNESWNYGGGIRCSADTAPFIVSNWILDNVTYNQKGGGVYMNDADPLLMNNVIAGNFANNDGGGVACYNSTAYFLNNTVADNKTNQQGGGFSIYGTPMPDMRNCIVWGNQAADAYPGIHTDSTTLEVVYSDIQGGWSGVGEGNIDRDPLFKDPFARDYYLTYTSPCINMGTNWSTPNVDITYHYRPHQGTTDMGAYEFVGIPTLGADAFEINESDRTVISLTLDAMKPNGLRPYLIFGSVTGTTPGVPLPLGGPVLPVNFDVFTDFVMGLVNSAVFPGFSGTLNNQGRAYATIDTLGPLPAGMVGAVLSFAYACPYKSPDGWFASNPVNIKIVP
jgi:hypothetical protein